MNLHKRLTRLLGNMPANPDLRWRCLLLLHDYQFDMICVVATSCDTPTKLQAIDKLRVGLWNRLVGIITGFDLTPEERVALFGKGGNHEQG